MVIGEFDENLIQEFPWVEFIKLDCVKKRDNQYNPHLDMMNKMEYAYNLFKDTYLGFIWMVDDNYAIKPFDLTDIMTVHYHEPSFVGWKDLPTSYWKHDKWKTRQLMDQENLPHINYTTHYPCYLDFEKIHFLCNKYDMLNESYVIEDVYFNYFPHEEPV